MKKHSEFVEKIHRAWASRNLKRVIRANCFECMGGQINEIENCTSPTCAFYPFRNSKISIRQGWESAVDELKKQGNVELAKKSLDLKQKNAEYWENRNLSENEVEEIEED
jgi:hypothetical protein